MMDRIIQIPIWVIFFLIFIGAVAGAFVSVWIDYVLERLAKRGGGGDDHIEKA